jgi:glycosyltransferase involved in cell wall biosynthesis
MSSPGRTLLITTSTFPTSLKGGGPRFIFDLAKALTVHFDVTVLAPHAPGATRSESWDGVQIERFRYTLPTSHQRLAYGGGMRENMRASWMARLQVPLLLMAQAWRTRRLAKRQRVTAVNSHWLVPQGLTAAFVRGRRRPQFRHVVHVHAADVYLLRKLPLGRWIVRFVLARADAVLADGSHVRDALDELAGQRTGAVLQPMGAWVDEFGRSGPAIESPFAGGYLAFVGRLVEKKGVIYLLRAMERLLPAHPQLGLVVVGDGPLRHDLEKEAADLGIGAAVAFTGALPHQEVIRHLRGCRVAVVPSVIDSRGETEGMPTVVVELMAAGLRVVGSRVNGIPDVLKHHQNGWLAEPADPEDLAAKLREALADPTPSAIVEQAQATAARFDWRLIAEDYTAVLLGLRHG